MALANQPYFPFFPKDWMSDQKLKLASPQSHGIYIQVMCLMHEGKPYGSILYPQKFHQNTDQILNFCSLISRLSCFSESQVEAGLRELLDAEILLIRGNFLVCKRMVCDGYLSLIRSLTKDKAPKKMPKLSELKENFDTLFDQLFVGTKEGSNAVNVNEDENEIFFKEKQGNKETEVTLVTSTTEPEISKKIVVAPEVHDFSKGELITIPEKPTDAGLQSHNSAPDMILYGQQGVSPIQAMQIVREAIRQVQTSTKYNFQKLDQGSQLIGAMILDGRIGIQTPEDFHRFFLNMEFYIKYTKLAGIQMKKLENWAHAEDFNEDWKKQYEQLLNTKTQAGNGAINGKSQDQIEYEQQQKRLADAIAANPGGLEPGTEGPDSGKSEGKRRTFIKR